MGSTGAARTGAGGSRRGSGLRPVTAEERRQFRASTGRSLPRDAMTSDRLQNGRLRQSARSQRSTPIRSRGAGTGAVSREEFERATGRTPSGRRTRRRR